MTLAHELAHVHQEITWPGLLELGNLARDYVAQNDTAFPQYPCELFIPVNLHAEAQANRDLSVILGHPAVVAYYADWPALRDALDRAQPDAAANDLAAFFSAHWSHFVGWYQSRIRPTKPSLSSVQRFVAEHSRQLSGNP